MSVAMLPFRTAQAGVLLLICLVAPRGASAADPIKEVGKTASEWVKTRAETVRIENAWTQDRTLLNSTLNGYDERATRLQDRRDHLFATTADERAEQASLKAKLSESRENLKVSEARLVELTGKIIRLRPYLPPRLAEALEMSYRSLDSAELSPGERMQRVMTVLNRCAQFNLTLTHGEEVLLLESEGGPKAFDVIYWGLSHAYAIDRAAGKAWLGSPGPEHWQWEPLPGAAPSVVDLMAIRLDQADPRLVSIPAQIKAANGGRP